MHALAASTTGRSDWLAQVLDQLDAIGQLPSGWDSHGGDAIDGQIVAAAVKLVRNLARFPEVPRPHVAPTNAGGIQFEWEANGTYFEIHFEKAVDAYCYLESESPPLEKEFTFRDGDDMSILTECVSRVTGS
jgi:hypothetical protein